MTNLKIKKPKNHTYTVAQDLMDLQDSVFPTVNVEISEQATIEDHLYSFERFLQGIGFVLPENSRLDFVENAETDDRNNISITEESNKNHNN
jgi:hypothetical protein